MSMMESIKRRDPELAGITRKITQRESQKIDFIIKVIEYGLSHQEFSVITLQKHLKISRNSLDKTIHLLLEKKFIKLNSIKIKNEKFYKIISKIDAKKYRDDLHSWKIFKIAIKVFPKKTLNSIDDYQRLQNKIQRTIRKNTKRRKFFARNISYLESIPLRFKINSELKRPIKLWSKPVYLKSLPTSDALAIIEKYRNFRICDVCLKEEKIVDVYNISNDEVVCIEKGHYFNLIKK